MDGEVVSTLPEAESRDSTISLRASLAAVRAHPTLLVAASLVGLAAVSTLLHSIVAGWTHSPRVFMDELGYEQMANSFAHTGHFSVFGKGGLAYSPLYPIVLSPIYALTSSAHTAYEWSKVENAVLISLAVFPIYGIARSMLSRGRAVGVAALSLAFPLMLYSTFEMSESLAYPLCLVAVWAMLRAVRRPSLGNDALLLGAVVLASTARLQLVALIPAALTAILLVALLPEPAGTNRGRAVLRAVSRHRLLFGVAGTALVAVLARTAMNGGNLPLAGRYANVGKAHAGALRVVELFFQHLAELDFAVGVIPFAAALVTGYALVRLGFPRRALIFASVALATTFWLLLEVAADAAAFDAPSLKATRSSGIDLPRIHERYLIYVMPLFLVALVAALPLLRKKGWTRGHLTAAVAAAALPALIPFGTIINSATGIDSFALQMFGTTKGGHAAPIPHATTLIVALSIILVVVYVIAATQPFPSMAILATCVALLWMANLELNGQRTKISWRSLGVPSHPAWVDRVVGAHGDVSLVSGPGVKLGSLEQTAFWNRSIARVYSTCDVAFGSDFGETQLTRGGVATRYAVVPAAWHVPGRVLARDRAGKLVLVAASGRTPSVPAPDCRS